MLATPYFRSCPGRGGDIAQRLIHFKLVPIVLFVIILDLIPDRALALSYQGPNGGNLQQATASLPLVQLAQTNFDAPTTPMLAADRGEANEGKNGKESNTPKPSKGTSEQPVAASKPKAEGQPPAKAPPEEINWIIDEPNDFLRQQEFSILFAFGPSYPGGQLAANFGTLLWYTMPILHRGIIPTINNAFALEFGGFVGIGPLGATYYPGPIASAAGGVRWDFYLTNIWRLFATLKVGATIWDVGPFGIDINGAFVRWPIYPNLGIGSLFRISETFLIRLDLDFPRGLIAGITFAF